MQWAVVVRSNQQGLQRRLTSGQLEDEIDTVLAVADEGMLFDRSDRGKRFTHMAAHRHQTQRIPARVTRDRDGGEVLKAGWCQRCHRVSLRADWSFGWPVASSPKRGSNG